jgi:hypothetical protein
MTQDVTRSRGGSWRALRVAAIVALLLLTAYAGISGGIDSSRSAARGGQRLAATTQLIYGASAIAALIAIALRLRVALPLLILWGAALTVTGGLAPVVWGEGGIPVGLAAGLSVAVVVFLVVRGWRKHSAEHG